MLNLLVATLVSAVVGYASIAFLLSYLRRHSTISLCRLPDPGWPRRSSLCHRAH
jgi:hypothetical protein